jgi:Ti-type conjugative transfer relaxase TraA
MAIQFARIEYVSRSTGANSCRKAAYNERSQIKCERTGEIFHFKHKKDNVFHDILLPEGADQKFKNSPYLWNAAEKAENRKDSQVAKEAVVALPDDKEINLQGRIEIARRVAVELFLSKGLAVQVDIHAPHDDEKNWHAHMLATTRRFSEDGKFLNPYKARDTDPTIRKGLVTEAELIGEKVRDIQNEYFKEKGLSLRVDPIGIVSQEHLGPVRMRHHMNDALKRSELIKQANEELVKDPKMILETVGKHKSVISREEIHHFVEKHIPREFKESIKEEIFSYKELIPLYDPETKGQTDLYTLKETRESEKKLLRFMDSIASKESHALSRKIKEAVKERYTLTEEQHKAYELATTSSSNLSVIQGRAGVGKSYVLKPIREAHEESGYRVIGLAPTNKVAIDMIQDGFMEATTCHAFLFSNKNNRDSIDSNTLLIVDEAAMLSTELHIELANVIKQSGAKVLYVGDDRQLSSIEKGGMFKVMAERYENTTINRVRRQEIEWQREVSELFSEGHIKEAVALLDEKKRLNFSATKEQALTDLINEWTKDSQIDPDSERFILAQRNVDVDAFNLAIRDLRRTRGEFGSQDYEIMTERGVVSFAKGDRIQLTETEKSLGLINGSFGTIKEINKDICTLQLDDGSEVSFNPISYRGLRHGYAGTVYKAQGSTIPYVYVLHSNVSNTNTSYVALTRQETDLKIFISEQETKSLDHFIHQMSRQDGKGASLHYTTLEEINEKEREKTLLHTLGNKTKEVITSVKDGFHSNEDFYHFEKQKTDLKTFDQEKLSKEVSALGKEVIERLTLIQENCSKRFTFNPEDNQKLKEVFENYKLSTQALASQKPLEAIQIAAEVSNTLKDYKERLGLQSTVETIIEKVDELTLELFDYCPAPLKEKLSPEIATTFKDIELSQERENGWGMKDNISCWNRALLL